VSHFIDTLEVNFKSVTTSPVKVFSRVISTIVFSFFLPQAFQLLKKIEWLRWASFGGNFTEEDLSTCYNIFFSYQIIFSHTMVTHMSKTLMSRLQLNIRGHNIKSIAAMLWLPMKCEVRH